MTMSINLLSLYYVYRYFIINYYLVIFNLSLENAYYLFVIIRDRTRN